MGAVVLLLVGCSALLVGCSASPPPPAPVPSPPHPPPICNINIEHECEDRGCCLDNWSCGPDDPTCPAGSCCYLGGPLGPQNKIVEYLRTDGGKIVGVDGCVSGDSGVDGGSDGGRLVRPQRHPYP